MLYNGYITVIQQGCYMMHFTLYDGYITIFTLYDVNGYITSKWLYDVFTLYDGYITSYNKKVIQCYIT